jgi:glutamate-1-semialdehyde 2,1-aminomutase
MLNRMRIKSLLEIEVQRYRQNNVKSLAHFEYAKNSLMGGVPMSWMSRWPGDFPLVFSSAEGAYLEDLDGNSYVDFCLGDTSAMAGHAVPAINKAIHNQLSRGASTMLPSQDAALVSKELANRFGLPFWQFTVSATDANRHAIRYSRFVTEKSKVIVIDRCYHGSVDEAFATLDSSGQTVMREGNIGAPYALAKTTRVVEFNDLYSMEEALKQGDVAAILMEPAMTNVGIVLPEDGYLLAVGELAREYDAKWIIDETHTISMGPGGMTADLELKPDFLTIGKAIGGGIPTGTFGMTHHIATQILEKTRREVIDTGGIGGTLAGNAVSLAAIRATLTEALTEKNFKKMIALGNRWCDGVEKAIRDFRLPWHVNRLGARGEYTFQEHAPRNGREAGLAVDFELEQYIHLRLLNDGFLLTPFHNMALMSPYTSESDVDAHTEAFRSMCDDLTQ